MRRFVLLALVGCADFESAPGPACPIVEPSYVPSPVTLDLLAADGFGPYHLSALPTEGTLGVAVVDDDVLYVFLEGSDWEWEPTANAVTFFAYEPPVGAEVRVTYLSLDDALAMELGDHLRPYSVDECP